MFSLLKTFAVYLKTQGASPLTIKNYLCDLNHFLGWTELFLRGQNLPFYPDEPKYFRQYFNQNLVARYKNYLTSNSLPWSTINRRLSTLRSFAKFCLAQAWISENPTQALDNVAKAIPTKEINSTKIVGEFKDALEAENNSSNTIKNYLADLREFLTFVETAT